MTALPDATEALPDAAARPTISVREAARALGISATTAYQAVDTGTLPSIRLGRRIVIPTAALRRLLDLDERPPAA
jgi:excisionase family DNA binding protein